MNEAQAKKRNSHDQWSHQETLNVVTSADAHVSIFTRGLDVYYVDKEEVLLCFSQRAFDSVQLQIFNCRCQSVLQQYIS